MYSDRSRKRSIKDRLGESVQNGDEPGRHNYKKRLQGFDGAWKNGMFEDADSKRLTSISEQISSQDLRAKLKKNVAGVQSGNDASSVIRDLREKLSGPVPPPQARMLAVPVPQQLTCSTLRPIVAAATTVSRVALAMKPNTAKALAGVPQVEAMTLASFLQSLGLSKYLIAFQAEEIDMSVLRVMKDAELKELGIPMGPRKKILVGLAGQSKR